MFLLKGGVTASTGVNEVKGCMPRILSASLKRQKKHKSKRYKLLTSRLVGQHSESLSCVGQKGDNRAG